MLGAFKEYYFGRTVVRVRHRSGHLALTHNEKGVLDNLSSIVSFFEREDKGKLITTYSAVSVSIACMVMMVYFLLYVLMAQHLFFSPTASNLSPISPPLDEVPAAVCRSRTKGGKQGEMFPQDL